MYLQTYFELIISSLSSKNVLKTSKGILKLHFLIKTFLTKYFIYEILDFILL